MKMSLVQDVEEVKKYVRYICQKILAEGGIFKETFF